MENYEKIFLLIKQKDLLKFQYVFPDSSSLINIVYNNQQKNSKNNDLYEYLVHNILEYTDFFIELIKLNSYAYSFFIADLYKTAIFSKFNQIDIILSELKKIKKIDFDSFFIKYIVDYVFETEIKMIDLFEAFSRNGLDIASKRYFNKNIGQAILEQKTKKESQVIDILMSLEFLKKNNFDFNKVEYDQKTLIDFAYCNMCDIKIIKWLNDEVTVVSGMEDIYFADTYKNFEPYNNYLIHRGIFLKYPLFLDIGSLDFTKCNLAFPKKIKRIYKLKSLKQAIEQTLGICSKTIYKAVLQKIVYFENNIQIINHQLFVFLELLNEILIVNIEKKNINLIVKLINGFQYKKFGYELSIADDIFSNLRVLFQKMNHTFLEKMFVSEWGISGQMYLISNKINKHQSLISEYLKYFKKHQLHKKINNLDEFRENLDSYLLLRSTSEETLPIVKKNNIKFDKYTFKQAKTNIELILWGINQKNCVGSKKYSIDIQNGKLRIYGIFIEEELVGIVSVKNENDNIDELQFLGFSKEDNSQFKIKMSIEKIFGGK